MPDYLTQHGTKETPQSEPMPGTTQVANSAGGYVFELDKWGVLQRFLILGSESPTYYAASRTLTAKNVKSLHACIAEDGIRTVNQIREVSLAGRAPQNDPALFALAACFSLGDTPTKLAAGKALPEVARIGTHLYHFVAYAETMRGWGRMMRKAIDNWYEQKGDRLAYEVIKYRQRDGWSHRDLLRLSHAHAGTDTARSNIFDWVTHQPEGNSGEELIDAFRMVQNPETTIATVCTLIREYRLPREALRTEHLNDVRVWVAMLDAGMPLGALVRNLATMTRIGVTNDFAYVNLITSQLGDQGLILKSRLHPMAILIAQRTYATGVGFRGQNRWTPRPEITDALDEAFYLAFGNVASSGKRTLLALDISGSMATGTVAGSNLTPREASVAMALITLHAEPICEVMGFTSRPAILPLSRRQRLDDAIRSVSNLPMGSTDCSLPFLAANPDHAQGPESFVVYTDNETWAGRTHPKQALDAYRQKSGLAATSIVVGLTATNFTIADPSDRGMLDVVGFDAAAPQIMSEFAAGKL